MRLQLLKKTFAKVNTLKSEKLSFSNATKITFFLMLGIFLLLLKAVLHIISNMPEDDFGKSSSLLEVEGKYGTDAYREAVRRENPQYF